MKTSKHIDWLSITIPARRKWKEFIPFADLSLQGKGRHGYGQAWIDRRTGARIETDSNRDDMGTHLTLSGDVLQVMRDDLGAMDDKLVERIQEWDGKCSRLDLAIDIFGAGFVPNDLNEAIQNGSAHLHARTWRYIDGHSNGVNGATLDTGSPKSDRRFRFYDKRAEKRIKDGEAWVRLELQLRRLYARAGFGACVEHGCIATASNLIGSYLSWSHDEYRTAIASGDDFTMTIQRSDSARQKWLLGQVASALAKELDLNMGFFDRFMLALCAQIERINADIDNPNR